MSYMMNKDCMIRLKPKAAGAELRPGGMLVQRRMSDANCGGLVPTIRVRIKHGSSYHEVIISSQASFGELQRILTSRTGLNVQEQKLVFNDRERHSRDFLDLSGVKDGSKILLLETNKIINRQIMCGDGMANMDKAEQNIATIRFEVDKLAKLVESVEMEINRGKKVVEGVLLNLIEVLMTQLIKLDGIAAEGNVKLQRRMEVKRVQKYMETLDVLKIRNSELEKKQHMSLVQLNRPVHKTFHKQKELLSMCVTRHETF